MNRNLLLMVSLLLGVCAPFSARAGDRQPKTENVFLIISDGLRWQEIFPRLGQDFQSAVPQAAPPIADLLSGTKGAPARASGR